MFALVFFDLVFNLWICVCYSVFLLVCCSKLSYGNFENCFFFMVNRLFIYYQLDYTIPIILINHSFTLIYVAENLNMKHEYLPVRKGEVRLSCFTERLVSKVI